MGKKIIESKGLGAGTNEEFRRGFKHEGRLSPEVSTLVATAYHQDKFKLKVYEMFKSGKTKEEVFDAFWESKKEYGELFKLYRNSTGCRDKKNLAEKIKKLYEKYSREIEER